MVAQSIADDDDEKLIFFFSHTKLIVGKYEIVDNVSRICEIKCCQRLRSIVVVIIIIKKGRICHQQQFEHIKMAAVKTMSELQPKKKQTESLQKKTHFHSHFSPGKRNFLLITQSSPPYRHKR